MKKKMLKAISFFANPKLLLCLAIGWSITNGWSYIMMAFGLYFKISWMIIVAGAYLTFLWLPISPEKLVTVAIAVFLLNKWFPDDQKTLAVLKQMKVKIKNAVNKKSSRFVK